MPSVWPVDPAILAPFLLAAVISEITPGPNMGWLALVALSRGRTAGMAAVAGVTLGLIAWMTAAALGVSEVVLRWPALYELIRWSGIGFLLWLAWEAWRGDADPSAVRDGVDHGRRALFLRGLIGNLLNPKAAVFYVALLPTFITPGRGSPLAQGLLLGGLHVAVAVIVHTAIVLTASRASGAVLTRAQGPWARALMAGGLVLIAAWMAWETRL